MIYHAAHVPDELDADLCVIGCGAGGAMVAMVAAEAGLRVLVLEAGDYITPDDMTQREEQMLPRLYWDAAARTTDDRRIRVHQGKGVGGSTLHNLNLCKRIPEPLLTRWVHEQHLQGVLEAGHWSALYDEVEQLLQVEAVPRERWNRHNRLLERGCEVLGWRGGGLRHNRTGCVGSGFCELGCAYDGKNNAAKVLVPRAVQAGAEIVVQVQAVQVLHDDERVAGVEARVVLGPGGELGRTITVRAPRVCLSASATGTAALLLRSNVPEHSGQTGARLRLHPAVVVAGDFADPVLAWQGIPQTFECTEFLRFEEEPGASQRARRLWIVPAFGHPAGVATMMPAWGALHHDLMKRYAHLAVLTAMLHDSTAGRVVPRGDAGLTLHYQLVPQDRRELLRGVEACAQLLFAAGARRVIVPAEPLRILEHPSEVKSLAQLRIEQLPLSAVHPMGTVPMSGDPRHGAVGPTGRHHHVAGLWLADGSLFPSSVGVPPQLSIYALGLHVGRALVAAG